MFTGVFNTDVIGLVLTNPSITYSIQDCARPCSDRVVLLTFILASWSS